ncbi:MAG: CCA tRNA nucleotidyltransferase [Candidatus Omnitrophica bacterium]|nr:CCA tRNA nucleotidyltransferase [Candidatus Omnitrophota bacterium]
MRGYIGKLPKDVVGLLKICADAAEGLGFRAYVVGGFVRDLILGVRNLDVDIAIEGGGIAFADELSKKLGGEAVRHKHFGTATVVSKDGFKIDIATARKESYHAPAQLPTVKPGLIEDDLKRRDFTINAMAIDISRSGFGRLLDLFDCREDLKTGKIRVLHDRSFIDDPTRIMRAVRFEQRYDFRIEPRTETLLREAAELKMLDIVQKHRVRDELMLMLKEDEPIRCIKRLNNIYGFSFLHPGLKLDNNIFGLLKDVGGVITWFRKRFPSKRPLDTWLMYLMALLDRLSVPAVNVVCGHFAFRRGETKRIISCKKDVNSVIGFLKKKGLRPYLIYKKLEPLTYEVILLAYVKSGSKAVKQRVVDFLSSYNETRISVSGEDIRAIGLSPGPRFKKMLEEILFAKIDGRIKTRKDELDYLRRKGKAKNR